MLPLFALAGSLVNLRPWLREHPAYALFYPFMYLLWLGKGVGVLESALAPSRTLRVPQADATTVHAFRPAPSAPCSLALDSRPTLSRSAAR
jgi:hypothetical protein